MQNTLTIQDAQNETNARRVSRYYQSMTLKFLVAFVLLDIWLYMYVLWIVVCLVVLFHLAIVLFIPLRYTDSDYPYDIKCTVNGRDLKNLLAEMMCHHER
jgi:hypothetical protein